MNIPVKDYLVIQEPKIAKSISIQVVSLKLNESVTLDVYLYDTNAYFIEKKIFHLENDEYKAWGNDDSYIENIIFSKIGLEKLDLIQHDNIIKTNNVIE
jgi:hypothetical protein